VKKLKEDIKETRKRLNKLVEKNAPNTTKEILEISQKLERLINDYYQMVYSKASD
jgi:vacuolar-type H+-ATPase subunit D/Vma8